jgi:hypothetical protein
MACTPAAAGSEVPAVIYDLDIRTAALLMLKRYGGDATRQAVNRASDLLNAGDVKGAFIWHLVRNCIERLQARKPADGEACSECR